MVGQDEEVVARRAVLGVHLLRRRHAVGAVGMRVQLASEPAAGDAKAGGRIYSFEYGTPSAAGGIERPTSPATAISVTT
jgi:hypothetical protein